MVWTVFLAFWAVISCCRMVVWECGPNLSWMSFTYSFLSSQFFTCGWKIKAMCAHPPTISLQQKSKVPGDKCWCWLGYLSWKGKRRGKWGLKEIPCESMYHFPGKDSIVLFLDIFLKNPTKHKQWNLSHLESLVLPSNSRNVVLLN